MTKYEVIFHRRYTVLNDDAGVLQVNSGNTAKSRDKPTYVN